MDILSRPGVWYGHDNITVGEGMVCTINRMVIISLIEDTIKRYHAHFEIAVILK